MIKEKAKRKNDFVSAQDVADRMLRLERMAKRRLTIIICMVLGFAALTVFIYSYLHYRADVEACMRFYDLTYQNCIDYLRLVAK